MFVRETRSREVFCVTCGAFAGAACRTSNGHVMRGYHDARKEVAAMSVTEIHGDKKTVRRVSRRIAMS